MGGQGLFAFHPFWGPHRPSEVRFGAWGQGDFTCYHASCYFKGKAFHLPTSPTRTQTYTQGQVDSPIPKLHFVLKQFWGPRDTDPPTNGSQFTVLCTDSEGGEPPKSSQHRCLWLSVPLSAYQIQNQRPHAESPLPVSCYTTVSKALRTVGKLW